jgi:hypothetical protein
MARASTTDIKEAGRKLAEKDFLTGLAVHHFTNLHESNFNAHRK